MKPQEHLQYMQYLLLSLNLRCVPADQGAVTHLSTMHLVASQVTV